MPQGPGSSLALTCIKSECPANARGGGGGPGVSNDWCIMGLKFTLNERLETIQKLDETILENSKGRDIEKEVEDCGEFCAKVYRILARIDLSLEDAKNSANVGTLPSFSQINNNLKSNEGSKLKLPKLELKSFSGNYEEWQSFWDNFESAVNRNTEISRIQEFTYLKSCVTGAAESAITGLPLSLKIITKLPLIFLETDLVNHSC